MGTLFLSGWSVALAQTDSTATEKGATLAAAPVAVSAPTETVSKAKEEPKLSVKPTGRILFDAALFAPKNQKICLTTDLVSQTLVLVWQQNTTSGMLRWISATHTAKLD